LYNEAVLHEFSLEIHIHIFFLALDRT